MEELTLELLDSVIENREVEKLRTIFNEYNSVDIAELLTQLPVKKAVYTFSTVPSENTAEVFNYLEDEYKEQVIASLKEADLRLVLEELYTDDIADVIEEMPANIVRKVLKSIDKDTKQKVTKLLNYKEDSAGTLMNVEYVELKENDSCKDAIVKIRKVADDVETISYAYVVSEKRDLLGYISLKEIITHTDEEKITDIMERDIISVNVDDDKEDVASTFKKYDLSSIAVVSKQNKMLGIITADDIIDVIDEEATEDIEKMAKMVPLDEDYFKVSVFSMFKKRAGWLIALMFASTLSAFVLTFMQGRFTDTAIVVLLAAFMPMITDTAGNAGSQTTALLIRGLSLGTIETKDYLKALFKEMAVGLCVGLCLAAAAFLWLWIESLIGIVSIEGVKPYKVFLTIGISLCAVVIVSNVIATSLPILAKKIKVDPAVMAGPLVTTIADAVAILVYFSIALLILQVL